jgi:hypothetical protein
MEGPDRRVRQTGQPGHLNVDRTEKEAQMSSWCPPLFDESPQRYTKRLFLYASDEIAELLRQKYGVSGYVTQDYEYMAHMAWLIGATSAAQALIREVDVVKNAWGKGDEQKTLSLINVCTAHMISVWLGGIDRQPRLTGDGRIAGYENAAHSMLSVINKFLCTKPSDASALTAQDVRQAMNMDRQWNSEKDDGKSPLAYASLVLARALDACGQRCLEWDRVVFPVESVQQLLDRGAILDLRLLEDSQRLLAVVNCMEQGVGSVRRYYLMNMEGKVQPSAKP